MTSRQGIPIIDLCDGDSKSATVSPAHSRKSAASEVIVVDAGGSSPSAAPRRPRHKRKAPEAASCASLIDLTSPGAGAGLSSMSESAQRRTVNQMPPAARVRHRGSAALTPDRAGWASKLVSEDEAVARRIQDEEHERAAAAFSRRAYRGSFGDDDDEHPAALPLWARADPYNPFGGSGGAGFAPSLGAAQQYPRGPSSARGGRRGQRNNRDMDDDLGFAAGGFVFTPGRGPSGGHRSGHRAQHATVYPSSYGSPSGGGGGGGGGGMGSGMAGALVGAMMAGRGFGRLDPRALSLAMADGDFGPEHYEQLLALDEGATKRGVGARDLESNSAVAVVTEDATEGEAQQCAVCLEPQELGETIRRLRCLHSFHRACIDKWLSGSRTCPICKHSVGE